MPVPDQFASPEDSFAFLDPDRLKELRETQEKRRSRFLDGIPTLNRIEDFEESLKNGK